MNLKSMSPLLFVGLIGLFTIGSHFAVDIYRSFFDNRGIYWTHSSTPLTLGETRNDFQVSISGKPLQKHLDDRSLIALEPNGTSYSVVPEDVSVRLNHWDSIQSKRLTKAVFTSGAFGANLALLIIGLIQTLARRRAARRGTP